MGFGIDGQRKKCERSEFVDFDGWIWSVDMVGFRDENLLPYPKIIRPHPSNFWSPEGSYKYE